MADIPLDSPDHPDNYTDEQYAATYTEPGTEGACSPIPDDVLAAAIAAAEERFPNG